MSVLVLTLNEEANLPRCLDAFEWSDDVVVLDSGSTDRTPEVATARGARVVHRPFDNWSAHQNWAVQNIAFRHPWVYYVDADEVVTPELAEEIRRVTSEPRNTCAAYRVRRKDMFMGRWLKYSSSYPVWLLRLFRPERVRWERLVHVTATVNGPVGLLQEHMIHYPFSKGVEAWIAKHIEYARLESREAIRSRREERIDWAGMFSDTGPVRQRQALKAFSWRWPLRPLLRFLYLYAWRGGCLDGAPGLMYCRLVSMYQYMIDYNIRELLRRERGLPI